MKTTIEHEFKLGDTVYVSNNDAGVLKGTVIGVLVDQQQYDTGNTIYTNICYRVKTKYKEAVWRSQSVHASFESAFN